MTQRDDLDRMLSGWLDDPSSLPAPPYLGAVLERTRGTRQRPAWAYPERWLPMADKILERPASPPMRVARLALIALAILALAASAAVVGSRLLPTKPAIPIGGAAVVTFASIADSGFGQTEGDIYTGQADGTNLRQVTGGPEVDRSPAFSPDGTRIAFRSFDDGTGIDSIVVIDTGGGQRTVVATSKQNGLTCLPSGPTWSPDGKRLVFATNESCRGLVDLFIVPADGASPATRLLPEGMNGTHGTWSPDGTRIAFVGTDSGGTNGVYLVHVGATGIPPTGSQVRLLGSDPDARLPEVQSGPRWSPDGTEVAADKGFPVFNESSTDGFTILKADGSGERLAVASAHNPEWSPDGRRLAFYRRVDGSEYFAQRPCTVRIWVIDADGRNERRLDPLADGCGPAPAWSPDGTRLSSSLIAATESDPKLGFHLGIITVDGSSPAVILPDGVTWSWQPLAVPLPPAPSFAVGSPAP